MVIQTYNSEFQPYVGKEYATQGDKAPWSVERLQGEGLLLAQALKRILEAEYICPSQYTLLGIKGQSTWFFVSPALHYLHTKRTEYLKVELSRTA